MLSWMNHKLESRFLGEISTTSDMQIIQLKWWKVKRNWRGTKECLDGGEKVSGKVGLKLNIQKTKIMVSGPITSWERDGGKVEAVTDFIFLGSKSLWMVTAAVKLKDI